MKGNENDPNMYRNVVTDEYVKCRKCNSWGFDSKLKDDMLFLQCDVCKEVRVFRGDIVKYMEIG